jgi:hypothetical protein
LRQLELQHVTYRLKSSVAALQPYKSKRLGAGDKKTAASSGHVLNDPAPAAVLTEQK